MEGIVHLFYHGDDVVKGDPELQAWCREITEVGLRQAQERGEIPPRDGSSSDTLPRAESEFRTPPAHHTPGPPHFKHLNTISTS